MLLIPNQYANNLDFAVLKPTERFIRRGRMNAIHNQGMELRNNEVAGQELCSGGDELSADAAGLRVVLVMHDGECEECRRVRERNSW